MMKRLRKNTKWILIALEIGLILLILALPLSILEYLSLKIIGEPPINGKSWSEGVVAMGGEWSMRVLAVIGIIIMVHTSYFILKLKNKPLPERDVSQKELLGFFIATGIFMVLNFWIGYRWWDPEGFLGMGPLFFPSILSLVVLGLLPYLFKTYWGLEKEAFADSTRNIFSFNSSMIFIAYGYGLVSLIWHCCSFYAPKMFFFFFVIKLIQLWAVCSFFFMYGFKMLLSKLKPWAAFLITAILFGFSYPWHTPGFALTFTFFGLILCILVRKTDSFIPGLVLLYFAYIFHAGLAWQGPNITFTIIFPTSLGILAVIIYANIKIRI